MLIFSLKNAFRKKTTAILASLGIGFGLMLVFVLGAFNAGINAQLEENLNDLVGQVRVTEKGKDLIYLSYLPEDIVDDIYDTKNIKDHIIRHNVETHAPYFFTEEYDGQMDSSDDDKLVLVGLDKDLDEDWGGPTTKIEKGEVFSDGKNEVIIDSRLRGKADFDIDIGDDITIKLNQSGSKKADLEIVGRFEQEESGAPSFVSRTYYIYTSIETMWDLLDEANETTDHFSSVYFLFDAKDADETNKYSEDINEFSEDGGYSPTYVSAFSLVSLAEAIQEAFSTIFIFTTVIGLVATISGGMAIIVTQMMSVSSRMKEFAILKATGWKNSHIFKNVIYESVFLGLVGAAIGLGLGTLLILALGSGAGLFGGATPYLITAWGIAQVFIYALVLGIIGGIYPAIKASRIRPVAVLKGE